MKEGIKKLRKMVFRNNPTLQDLLDIKDKSVLLTGPSPPNTEEKSNSNNHDIVISFNTAIEYADKIFKNEIKTFGNRIDIIYLSTSCEAQYFRNLKGFWKDVKIKPKVVRLMGPVSFPHGPLLDHQYSNVIKSYKKRFIDSGLNIDPYYNYDVYNVLTKLLTKHNFIKNKLQISVVPRVGTVALFEILLYQPRSIEIKNMTFYHGGTNIFRKDNTPEPFKPKKHNDGTPSTWHDSILELLLLKQMMQDFNIKVDSQLENILKENYIS
jgi:hypothetical protein|tara:strand:+ start:14760 stop:15560 length:801 start_codon:yes stop_codon:yes gene_type:complete